MRWYKATLYAPVETGGADELGHPVTEEREVGTAFLRKPPFKVARDATEGNPHGYVRRTFLTRAGALAFQGVTSFEVLGARYDVEGLSEAGAETMVTGRCSKCALSSTT